MKESDENEKVDEVWKNEDGPEHQAPPNPEYSSSFEEDAGGDRER